MSGDVKRHEHHSYQYYCSFLIYNTPHVLHFLLLYSGRPSISARLSFGGSIQHGNNNTTVNSASTSSGGIQEGTIIGGAWEEVPHTDSK